MSPAFPAVRTGRPRPPTAARCAWAICARRSKSALIPSDRIGQRCPDTSPFGFGRTAARCRRPIARRNRGRNGPAFARHSARQVLSVSSRRSRAAACRPFGRRLDADARVPLLRGDAHRLRARLVHFSADELQADVGRRERRRLELREQRQLVFVDAAQFPDFAQHFDSVAPPQVQGSRRPFSGRSRIPPG